MKPVQPSASALFRAAVGERVFVWRIELGLTREEVGKRASLSADYIYRLEQGWANPRVTTLQSLATALETTVAELLEVDGNELGVAAAAKSVESKSKL